MVCVVGTRLWDIMHILRKTSAECPTAVCQLYTPFLSVSVRVSNFEQFLPTSTASTFPGHKRAVRFLCTNCLPTSYEQMASSFPTKIMCRSLSLGLVLPNFRTLTFCARQENVPQLVPSNACFLCLPYPKDSKLFSIINEQLLDSFAKF